jgi:sugar phosphate isomerase/epimerase
LRPENATDTFRTVQARAVGVVSVSFGLLPLADSARLAAEHQFDHLDIIFPQMQELEGYSDAARAALPVPIADRISMPEVIDGCTVLTPWDVPGEDHFDDAVDMLRSHPNARLEPVAGTVAGSSERLEALLEAVPGLRLTLDTGHIVAWGGDPVAFLHHADHVQLRQSSPERPMLHPDEGGDVDFAAVLAELDRLDYQGLLSVEYFDQPAFGWSCEDPAGYSVALAAHVRALMG